ncbi:hypothetical protein ACQPW3_35690 [Actinosynnema sp. CA-248983]
MSFDWTGRTPIRVNVASWPIPEQVGSGRERARWTILTLDEFSVDELKAGLRRFSVVPSASGLDVQVEAVAADTLLMICEYDSFIPEPIRLGAASVTWRFLDEELARLWTIGGRPRSHFPEFMRQRRAQLDALPVAQRLYLMFISIARIEPLITAAAERPGSPQSLVEHLAKQVDDRSALVILHGLTSPLAVDLGDRLNRRSSGEPVKAHLGAMLIGLYELAAQAAGTRATSDIARCIEEVLDILYLFDNHYGADHSLARREDRDFRDDLQCFAVESSGGPAAILSRALESAEAINAAVATVDVRQELMDAILGQGRQ